MPERDPGQPRGDAPGQPRGYRRALGGPGVILVTVYGVLALAATGRSILQITTDFGAAPLAYTL